MQALTFGVSKLLKGSRLDLNSSIRSLRRSIFNQRSQVAQVAMSFSACWLRRKRCSGVIACNFAESLEGSSQDFLAQRNHEGSCFRSFAHSVCFPAGEDGTLGSMGKEGEEGEGLQSSNATPGDDLVIKRSICQVGTSVLLRKVHFLPAFSSSYRVPYKTPCGSPSSHHQNMSTTAGPHASTDSALPTTTSGSFSSTQQGSQELTQFVRLDFI